MGNKIRALSKKNKITDSEIEQSMRVAINLISEDNFYGLPAYTITHDKLILETITLGLNIAIESNDFKSMKDLVGKVSEREFRNNDLINRTPLMHSLRSYNSDEIVSYLIDIGGDIHTKDMYKMTPLHLAAMRDTSFITEKLLKRGADFKFDLRRRTALDEALSRGKEENVWCLLNFISANNIKFSYKKILYDAIYHCSPSVIEELIKRGADVNYPTVMWETPLHAAIESARPEIVHLLLYYNASVNEYDECGRALFSYALYEDKIDQFLPYLIEYVDDFDKVDRFGMTLLFQAIIYNPKYIPILIKEKEVNVNLLVTSNLDLEYIFPDNKWRWPTSFDDFKFIWSHLNHELLLENLVTENSFLEEIVSSCPSHMYFDCLYLIFDSPHADKFVEKYLEFNPYRTKSLIYTFTARETAPEERIKALYLLISYGVDIQVQDIHAVYTRHGFSENLEVILTIGSSINYELCEQFCNCVPPKVSHSSSMLPDIDDLIYTTSSEVSYRAVPEDMGVNCASTDLFMIRQICYNSLDFDKHYGHKKRIGSVPLCYQHAKRVFCKNCLNYKNRALYHTKYYMNGLDEIPSLLQMCRDLIRLIIYKKWFTPHAFKVYQAFLQLPVPPKIQNILFLKEPIYFQ